MSEIKFGYRLLPYKRPHFTVKVLPPQPPSVLERTLWIAKGVAGVVVFLALLSVPTLLAVFVDQIFTAFSFPAGFVLGLVGYVCSIDWWDSRP